MYKKLIFFLLFTCTHIGLAQDTMNEKLDAYFKILEQNNKFMGSVAIYKNDRITYNDQFGLASIAEKIQPNRNTAYRIGSISKTFTAVLAFKAIEKGKLRLTDTLATYFPTIGNATLITISNLLNHRSGIHSFTDDKEDYLSFNTQFKSRQEMLAKLSQYKSDFEPNTQASYSNSNYLVVSYVLEKVFGKSFDQIVHDEISAPLGLEHTYYAEYLSHQNNEAYSYGLQRKQWKPKSQTNGSTGLGAGSLVSTPTDLIKFSRALFEGDLLSQKSIEQMKTIEDNFGMGLFKTKYFDTVSFGHNGGIDGFVSMFRYFPDEKMAFAIMANGLDFDFNAIETAVVQSMFNKHFDQPILSTYQPSAKELNAYLGTYSSTSFPVKLQVVKVKKQLVVEVAGQEPMVFQAFEKDKFKLDAAGMVITFYPDSHEMEVRQGENINLLQRE